MNIIVECPHCSGMVIIEQINCAIFRHGVHIANGNQMNPHECKEVCNNLASTNQIYGCGKPFKLTKNEDGTYLARDCEYIWNLNIWILNKLNQYSGVCFLNKHPCGVMPTISLMTAAFWNLQFDNQTLTMQKFFLGEIVMPFTTGNNALLGEMLFPTTAYVSCRQQSCTSLLLTLYEKHPPFRFLTSSQIGVIPSLIKNSMQFMTNLGGSISVTLTACSTVLKSYNFI